MNDRGYPSVLARMGDDGLGIVRRGCCTTSGS